LQWKSFLDSPERSEGKSSMERSGIAKRLQRKAGQVTNWKTNHQFQKNRIVT
jgi:hypothetical protein